MDCALYKIQVGTRWRGRERNALGKESRLESRDSTEKSLRFRELWHSPKGLMGLKAEMRISARRPPYISGLRSFLLYLFR